MYSKYEAAREIAGYTKTERQEVMFDPATLIMIVKIVSALVELYKSCNKTPEEATEIAHKPSRFHVNMVKRAVRREMGWWKYWTTDSNEVVEAVLKAGQNMNSDKMACLYNDNDLVYYQ